MKSEEDGLSVAVMEISPNLGFNCIEFQRLVVRKIKRLSKIKRQIKVYYLTYDRERVDNFIEEILCMDQNFTLNTQQSNQSQDSSSTYFWVSAYPFPLNDFYSFIIA